MTSGQMKGNNVTIGGQTNNYFFVNWQLASQNPSGNTSTFNWQAYFHYTNSDAQLDDVDASVGGQLVLNNGGRVKNYAGTFVTRDHFIASGTTQPVSHDNNGNLTINVNGSIGGSLSGRSSGSQNFAIPGFDRTPTTPSLTATNRNSTGTSFSTTSWSGSVNNSGPQVTWTIERADNLAFSTNVVNGNSTTSSGSALTVATPNANQTYYIRIRASNSVSTKYSSVITVNGVPSPPTDFTVTPSTTSESRVSLSWIAPTNTQGGISRYDIFVNDIFVESTTSTSLASIKLNSGGTAFNAGTSYNFRVASKNATNLNETAIANVSSSVTSNISAIAPGNPYAPTAAPTFTVAGLDVTVTSAAVSGNGGVEIDTNAANQGYYVQYQTATTLNGTYGFNGVNGAWSTPVKVSDQTARTHTFASLTPAIFYKFRTYAANSVIYARDATTQLYYPHNSSTYTASFATTTTGYFLAAGGRRWTGTEWVPTATAKRWDGNDWTALTIARRWDGNNWVNLS
jgi:hypothetical protein